MADDDVELEDNERALWEQQPEEPNKWFRRFEIYRRLGPNRAMLAAYRKESAEAGREKRDRTPGSWVTMFRRWKWAERAAAWDEHESEREEIEWQAKRRQIRSQEWEAAQSLIDKAKQMLMFPLAKTSRQERDEAGRLVAETTINPSKWTLRDVAAMFDLSSKLGRLAADMVTNRIEVNDGWQKEAAEAGLNPDEIFAEIVAAFKRRRDSQTIHGSVGGGGAPAEGSGEGAAGTSD